MEDLLVALVPVMLSVAGLVVGYGMGRLRDYVRSTDATWDDRLYEAVRGAVIDAEPDRNAVQKAENVE